MITRIIVYVDLYRKIVVLGAAMGAMVGGSSWCGFAVTLPLLNFLQYFSKIAPL